MGRKAGVCVCVWCGVYEGRLTAVGVEESYEPVFVPAYDGAFDVSTTGGAGGATYKALGVLGHASATIHFHGAVEADRGGDDDVDAGVRTAIVRLERGHADDFLARARVEDQDRGVVEGDDEGFAGQAERGYARW